MRSSHVPFKMSQDMFDFRKFYRKKISEIWRNAGAQIFSIFLYILYIFIHILYIYVKSRETILKKIADELKINHNHRS